MISKNAFDADFPRPQNLFTFVNVEGGASDSATAALERSLRAFPDVKIRTKDGWVANRAHGVDQLLTFLYVLLALSVIVSLFGMVNTLVLSVFERTRELGMLRAIGMTRRQVRRMVRHESVITALIGAGLGLPLGLFLAALVTQGLRSEGVGFHVPLLTLVIFAVIAVAAGILAAVVPARRAARLNVLEALQYE
jgi:putative ABC transport system permease protein